MCARVWLVIPPTTSRRTSRRSSRRASRSSRFAAGADRRVARRHRPDRRPARRGQPRGRAAPDPQGGHRPGVRRGVWEALAGGAELVAQMDADFPRSAGPPAAAGGRRGGGLVAGSRYVDGGGAHRLGPTRRAVSRWAAPTRGSRWGWGSTTSPGASRSFAGRSWSRSTSSRWPRSGTPSGRDDLSRDPGGLSGGGGADRLRDRRVGVEDERRDRARGGLARSCDAPARTLTAPFRAGIGICFGARCPR